MAKKDEKKKVVDKLSDKDMSLIPTVRDEWINIGLAVGRANRPETEKAINAAYEIAGLKAPKTIEWFDSPLSGYKRIKELDPTYENNISNIVFGQHDADWLSFYDFFSRCESVTIPEIEKLRPAMTIAKNAGWWWPFEDICIVTERPIAVHLDAAKRLHAEECPAVEYADGWGVFCWHGYRIPKKSSWIITDKAKMTPDLIDAEPNAELRRVMLEISGFENYLKNRKAKVLSDDVDGAGLPRRLMEVTVAGEAVRIIEVQNSSLEPDGTRRKFILGAMRGNTPHEAIAASFGFNPNAFKEEACS